MSCTVAVAVEAPDADVDKRTGLPRLSVELLPTMEEESPQRPSTSTSHSKTLPVGGHRPLSSHGHPSPPPPRELGLSSSLDIQDRHSYRRRMQQVPNRRSRSGFIKLQSLPRTPPLAQRNVHLLGDRDDAFVHTAPVVDGESRSFIYGQESDRQFATELRRGSDSGAITGSPSIGGEEEGGEEESPMSIRGRLTLTRRSSFLYLSDDDEDISTPGYSAQQMSRTPSLGSSAHVGDETYITPFAQILANLHRVRKQFSTLMSAIDDHHSSHTIRTVPLKHSLSSPARNTTPLPVPSPSPSHSSHSSARRHSDSCSCNQLARITMDELDWCLKKLETVDSAKSMGTMAEDKFQRILYRELSHLSEQSRSGQHVAQWVHHITNNSDRGASVDRTMDLGSKTRSQSTQLESHLSASLAHDEWHRIRNNTRSSPVRIQLPNQDYCERVPRFGVNSDKMDCPKMKQFMETKIHHWDVDVFYLNEISAGNPLITAAYEIFKGRKFFHLFKIAPPCFINFISAVQTNYHDHPYHNAIHAADVLISTNFLLKAKALENVFTSLEVLAVLVAAAVHDVDHPGRTNGFMVNSGHNLALLYNDISVLENHHLAVAFKLMQEHDCNILQNMDDAKRQAFRKMVIDMVLATDMTKHFKHLGDLKTLLETKKVANEGILVLEKYGDRIEVLQCLVHCADLSNPAKEERLAALWSHRVMEENFIQGDEEKSLGLPMSPLGDREEVIIEKCQVTFIDFVVFPLWETWSELVYPDALCILENLGRTREYWNSKIPKSPPPDEQVMDSSCFAHPRVHHTVPTAEHREIDSTLLPTTLVGDEEGQTEVQNRRQSFQTMKGGYEVVSSPEEVSSRPNSTGL